MGKARLVPTFGAAEAALRSIVAEHQAKFVDGDGAVCSKQRGIIVDAFSARAGIQVVDALNDANKAKLRALPLTRALSVCFKLLK